MNQFANVGAPSDSFAGGGAGTRHGEAAATVEGAAADRQIDVSGVVPIRKPLVALAGIHFDQAPWEPKGLTVCHVLMDYAREVIVANGGRNVEKRLSRYGYIVKQLMRHVDPQMPIVDVERKMGRVYTAARVADGVKPSTAGRELTFLTAALRHEKREERITKEYTLWKPPQPGSRIEVVTPEQEAAIMALDKPRRLQLFLHIGFNTGARSEAIEELTWDRVDLERRVIAFGVQGVNYRNKRRAVVPINNALLAVLVGAKLWRDQNEPHVDEVIGLGPRGRRSTTYHAITDCWARVGCKFRAPRHVLRHTVATRLLQRRVPVERVAFLLGDTMGMVLSTYAHFVPNDMASDVELVAA